MKTAIIERKNGRKRRRRTVYLPPELDTSLRKYCAEHDIEISVAIEQAVEGYLKRMTFDSNFALIGNDA